MKQLIATIFVLISVSPNIKGTDLSYSEIPFQLKKHWIVIQASIEGIDRQLNLALDTGSTTTVINKKFSKKLGLKGSKQETISFGSREKCERFTLPQLELTSYSVVSKYLPTHRSSHFHPFVSISRIH